MSNSRGLFKLMRYFAVTSAVVLVAVAVLLYQLYRQTAFDTVLGMTAENNAALAQALSNGIAPAYAGFQVTVADEGLEQAVFGQEFAELEESISSLVADLPVLKLVIYDLDGRIVYSSAREEIGAEGADDSAGFATALRMEPYNEIEYRESMTSLSGEFTGGHIVETYLHFHPAGGRMMGVFELYSDVSGRIAEAEQNARGLLAGLLLLFGLLYLCLQLVVWWANRTLVSQYEALEQSRADTRVKNERLMEEIARRSKVEDDLRQARDEAHAASTAKSRFLANMSHELRTPLNAIIGFSDIIAEEMFGRGNHKRYTDYARDIRSSGRHLLSLVNDILDLARIEAGRMPVKCKPVAVAGLVQETVRALEPAIAGNGNRLFVDCPESVGTVVTDGEFLRGILMNLVANAAKFTSDGRIEIAVTREAVEHTNWIRVLVMDSGIGIDPGRINEMFEEFSQQDSAFSRQYGGSGLGLAISRQYAEALGGGIDIASEPGVGTIVCVRIPDRAFPAGSADLAAE